MRDLSIEFMGINFKNPLFFASADHTHKIDMLYKSVDSGVAAVVAKTCSNVVAKQEFFYATHYNVLDKSFNKTQGEIDERAYSFISRGGPWKRIEDGWIDDLAKAQLYASDHDSNIIASLWGDIEWLTKAAVMCEQAGIPLIELDVGCPHLDGADLHGRNGIMGNPMERSLGLEVIPRAVNIPVIYKVASRSCGDIAGIVDFCQEAGFAAITVHNRYLGFIPDVETMMPILGNYTGVGGPWTLPLTLHNVYTVRKAEPNFPIIGTNGANNSADLIRFLLTGASAVEIATAVMIHGYDIVKPMLDEVGQYMERHTINQLKDIIGKATDSSIAVEDMVEWNRGVSVNRETCIGCGRCIELCPWDGLSMIDGVVHTTFKPHYVRGARGCIGCELCTCICPTGSLSVDFIE